MNNKTVARLALLLVVAEVVLVLLSWLLSATMTEDVRTLLSAEGMRWFFGHFSRTIGSPLLGNLLLLAMAAGTLWQSGLFRLPWSKDHRRGLFAALFLLIIYIGVVAWLAVVPHAVLLSATGSLWPSPFSRAFVPLACFGIILCAAGFGLVVRTITSLTELCQSLCLGISKAAPLFFLYVLLIQFYESLRFVFF